MPIGDQADRWVTFPFERKVLVVGRTLTCTLWGLDFLDEVLSDTRIQALFTVEDQKPSVYSRGAVDLLHRFDAVAIPWSQATATGFDLAISFSFHGSLCQLQCPLMLGLHGASLGKHGALPSSGELPLPRFRSPDNRIAPTTAVLPHPSERARFGTANPEVDFVYAGDPCLDRLIASAPQRDRYRSALSVGPLQRLVAVSSTWGPDSLLGTVPDIATRLASELPADAYRVALIIHPNIWTGHSGWQVKAWLKRARDAGVLAIPPWANTWRSVLVASDAVIHDRGSVSLFAAALGKPLLAAPMESDDIIPDSPTAELGRRAPTFRIDRALRPQIDRAIADHDPDRYQDVAASVSSNPGDSLRLHRDLIYRLLDLEVPSDAPRVLAVAPPPEPMPPIHSHHVRTSIVSHDRVALQRFPAMSPPPPPGESHTQNHIVCDTSEPDSRLPPNAAVIVDSDGYDAAEALLERYPGCRYVITRGDISGTELWHRHGSRFRLLHDCGTADASTAASAVYALETAGHAINDIGNVAIDLDNETTSWTIQPEP